MENKLVCQLISQLANTVKAQDHELDEKLDKLTQKIVSSGSYIGTATELHAVLQYLDDHPVGIKPVISEYEDKANSALEKLQKVQGLSNSMHDDIRSFLAEPTAHSLHEHQERLLEVIGFYQETLNTKEKTNPNFLRERSQGEEKPAPVDEMDPKVHERTCDELQRLITELDFAGEFGEALSRVRSTLLNGVEPHELPAICLKIINLIIDGTREERKASQAFLYSLNESLSSFHYSFNSSMSETRGLHSDQQNLNDELKSHIKTMGLQIDSTHDLLHLKLSIQGQLKEINKLLEAREGFENKEKELQSRLSQMEAKLKLMKEETSEYKKRLSSQKHKLFLDSLTHVYNRAALDERLELEFKRWQRYHNPLCLAIVDIDFFKRINDNYGHMAGDKALKVIARALQKSLRDTDFIARFGGEEFVILMPNLDSEDIAVPFQKLIDTIKAIPFKFKDNKVSITISIGTTLFKEGDQPLDAFERADQALYDAKHQGRDQVVISL